MLKIIISTLLLNFCNSQNNANPCKNNNDCTILGNDYTCISVQVYNSDLEYISQCVQEPSCSGKTFGSCPDFTNWPSKYQSLNPECSFSAINNCNNIANNNTVDCYNSKDNTIVYGIYKCINANTIKVKYNTTDLPKTQIPETNNPNVNNESSEVHIRLNLLSLVVNFIITLVLLY